MSRRSTTRLSMLGFVAAGFAADAVGAGTIETFGAILAPGPAPVTGVATVDAAAPAAEMPAVPRRRPLGSMGTFTVPMRRFPYGEVGDAGFRADGPVTLAAGTHLFSSFEVAAGAVVTCEGPVTIRTSGAVTIDGDVRVLVPGALQFVCGGDFSLGEDAVLRTEAGTVAIDALGAISAGRGALLSAVVGSVTLRAHGREGVAGDVALAGAALSATSGSHVVQAEGSIVLSDGAATHTVDGGTVLQAFGGDVLLSDGSGISMAFAPDTVRLEAAGAVALSGPETGIEANGADVRIRAFGGGLTLSDGAFVRVASGTFDLGARGTVAIDGNGEVLMNSGRIRLTSFEGDVRVAFVGSGGRIGATAADASIVAAGDVEISGDGEVGGGGGNLRIEAHGGDVAIHGGTRFISIGALDVLASGSLSLDEVDVSTRSVVLAAETGGIGLTGTRTVAAREGRLLAVAGSHLLVRTHLSSLGGISLASRDGAVDVGGQTIETAPQVVFPAPSGRIAIQSFGGTAGRIDVRGATVRTGASDDSSGDILVAVHDGVLPSPDEGYLVAETVTARRDLRRPQRSAFDIAGVLDMGTTPLAPGDVTLTVGSDARPLVLSGNARRLTARAPGIRLELRPEASGSSRTRFRLRRTGYVEELLTVDGSSPVAIGLRTAAADRGALVRLLSGRYRRGDRGEALIVPPILPSRIRARFADGAADSLAFEVDLAPLGDFPASAPAVRVTFGTEFTALVPSSAFVAGEGSEFVATDPLPGVRRVVLDYERSTLVFAATGVELGASDESESGLVTVLGIAVGGDTRAVRLRLGRRRGRLVY